MRLLAVFFALIFVNQGLSQISNNITTEKLTDFIAEYQSGFDPANKLSGVLYVEKGNETLLHKAYGDGIELDTQFGVASITKIFTSVLVNNLFLEGKLDPEHSISKWIPGFPNGDKIKLKHLVLHRAGIRHRVTTFEQESKHYSAEDLTKVAATHDLVFEPGSQRSYSTAGFGVLARVIELADEKPYAAVLQDRIFKPTGMNSSFDLSQTGIDHDFSKPMLPLNGKLVRAPNRHLSYLIGGGSSVSTVDDLLKFVNTLKEEKIGQISFEHMAPRGTARWVGASNGYFGWVDVFPDEDTTIIFLGNTWGGAGPALRDAIPAFLRGETPVPPTIPKRIEAPAESVLNQYIGKYQTRPGAWLNVVIKDGNLTFEDNYLVPIGKDEFWQPAWSTSLKFERDPEGKVTGIKRQDGTEYLKLNESSSDG